MDAVLVEQTLLSRRSSAIRLGIPPTIKNVTALPTFAATMRCRFHRCRTVIDDPDFAQGDRTNHDLVQIGVVGDSVEMQPIWCPRSKVNIHKTGIR